LTWWNRSPDLGKIIVTRFFISSIFSIVLGPCVLAAAGAEPTIYRCITGDGRVQYTDAFHKNCKVVDSLKAAPMTIVRARALLEELMNDPESARYKSLYQVQRTGAVCGRVNWRNRMGGYDGYRNFVVGESAKVLIEGEAGFYKAYEENCSETPANASK
jgi:hypothetical protein